MLAGALIRYSFVARHKARVQGRRTPWEHALIGTLAIVGLVVWLAPAPPPAASARAAAATKGPVGYAQARAVIDRRCGVCHGETMPQKGVSLQTAELLRQHAQQVYQQAVVLRQMPFNNATGMTDDERALLKRWYESGAPVQ
jgi:uncharacterized membrane protein